MKELVFMVTLSFQDKIYTDDDVQTIAENILTGLKNQTNACNGLAPNNSGTYTIQISVSKNNIILTQETL